MLPFPTCRVVWTWACFFSSCDVCVKQLLMSVVQKGTTVGNNDTSSCKLKVLLWFLDMCMKWNSNDRKQPTCDSWLTLLGVKNTSRMVLTANPHTKPLKKFMAATSSGVKCRIWSLIEGGSLTDRCWSNKNRMEVPPFRWTCIHIWWSFYLIELDF